MSTAVKARCNHQPQLPEGWNVRRVHRETGCLSAVTPMLVMSPDRVPLPSSRSVSACEVSGSGFGSGWGSLLHGAHGKGPTPVSARGQPWFPNSLFRRPSFLRCVALASLPKGICLYTQGRVCGRSCGPAGLSVCLSVSTRRSHDRSFVTCLQTGGMRLCVRPFSRLCGSLGSLVMPYDDSVFPKHHRERHWRLGGGIAPARTHVQDERSHNVKRSHAQAQGVLLCVCVFPFSQQRCPVVSCVRSSTPLAKRIPRCFNPFPAVLNGVVFFVSFPVTSSRAQKAFRLVPRFCDLHLC